TMNASHSRSQAAELEQQRRAEAERKQSAMSNAKRRAEKPTDKNVPEGVEGLIVGPGVQQYKRLREVEKKLDAIMMRKKLDQQEPLHNTIKRYSTLRIWISNTIENQPWQGGQMDENAFDFNMDVAATYKVKIEGRLIEEEDPDEPSEKDSEEEGNEAPEADGTMNREHEKKSPEPKQAQLRQKTKLSHFFKQITIDFDRNKNLQPDNTTQIEWKKPQLPPQSNAPLPPAADFDCLEFERKSDENINCTINFYRDENPERMQLSRELATVLDTTEDDRASVIMGLWEYVKAMGLAQDDDKRLIQCDDKLKAVFGGRESVQFPFVPSMIMQHLTPLHPLSLPYTIRVDPEYYNNPMPTVYTLRVPTSPPPPSTSISIPELKQLAAYDDHIALLIQALSASQRKHSFFTGYSKDPVTFVKRWMSSQKRDIEVVLGESGRMEGDTGMGLAGEWRKGGRDGVWGTEQVREGVALMTQKPGRDGRGF
ncbi:SWI/SNF complex component snf12, partial [Puttea exsequens]|nr:SWI/SNF complex component snf12 [Puttea exsequens]